MPSGYREWWKKFVQQDRRGFVRLVVIGSVGVLLLGFGGFGIARPSPPSSKGASSSAAQGHSPLETQERQIAAQVGQILRQIPGVTSVSVAVTLTRSIQSQYVDSSGAGNGTQPVVVSTNNGQMVVPFDQIGPSVGGVVVVAAAAKKPWIRAEIAQAVQTLLQIQPYQVLVLPN
jgi:stage III sporulation protein AG